ncbi:ERMIN protein, partial [Dromaius novaehollandiae]|nr:ERMIN protein [Dromaius novaehollandiae]
MTEEAPTAPGPPQCNGTVTPTPERGPLQVVDILDGIAKPAGTAPCANAETGPDAPLTKETQEENRNSIAEKTICGSSDGEKQREGKVQFVTLFQDLASPGANCVAAGPGAAGVPGHGGERQETRSTEAEESPAAGAPEPADKEHTEDEVQLEEREDATDEEEEDTEEDEVQLIEIKKENSEEPHLKKEENGKEVSPPASPTCNSQPEKAGEQPGLGKKNDISRHSYSRYNTISYRKIRKGNTKQRIDEFESMMHL